MPKAWAFERSSNGIDDLTVTCWHDYIRHDLPGEVSFCEWTQFRLLEPIEPPQTVIVRECKKCGHMRFEA